MTKALLEKIREIEEKVGKDWIEIFENLSTEAEIIEQAKKNGVELTQALAKEGLQLIQANQKDELSESELSAVAGGKIVFH